MSTVPYVLLGALAATSFVAALFFLRFWRQTHDSFFLFFSIAFGIDSVARFALALCHVTNDDEPWFYVPRLVTFGLIVIAIYRKNRPAGRNNPGVTSEPH
ncbi:MAG TPA: DUF5985 family protein [Acetobacteraceae bacterium]|nr:DUF5985 family protein [Acetobacteraceae bacterium]